MKYRHGTRRKAIEYEKDLVEYWKQHNIFEESVASRPDSDSYVFYDGPPFITGVPHYGTLLSSIVKDAVPRYWTMRGKRVERVWGWDCHGLPAENFVEKKLGIKDKRDIGTKISLEDYIVACRDNMVATGNEWEDTIDRIGRWVDFKGAYKTMDKDYMESVWWAFKELYDKGKIYEGEKVLLYCTRCATPISKSEVAMDNSYQDVTDPSVYVKLKLQDGRHLLAWTTTPWTLPANTAAAVNKDLVYADVETEDGNIFVLAKDLVERTMVDDNRKTLPYQILKQYKGSKLIGLGYEPLFENRGENAHFVHHADYVSTEEGTGVVHLAPAYGEEDFELAKQNNLPIVSLVDENGFYSDGDWAGEYVWDANKPIAKDLKERGVVWRVEYVKHSYPHCHRCGTKLMYRAHPSWFMRAGEQMEEMLAQNQNINWFPEHFKHGRFANNIKSAPDWNLSRDRFWATPLPVWKGSDDSGTEHTKVVGSYQELKDLSGVELEDYHRPWVDDITFTVDGVEYKRVDKVMDSWFESGSMPFAQFHYPFENSTKFEANFPGDFIAEYVGQVRAWFYYLHAVSVGLFGVNSFKNVIVTGTIAGNDGRKMSKSYGNYTDPNELMDSYSADALRFLLLSSPLLSGEDYALVDKDVADVQRKLAMIWNMYDFFTMYAEVDKWEWDGKDEIEPRENLLDIWIVSRLHMLINTISTSMNSYDLPGATKPILSFIDDASNWYVRRSRRRFWKSDDDNDKAAAYETLHYVLSKLALVMAPFTPFLAEELYRQLTNRRSVHLQDWPQAGHVSTHVVEKMSTIREIITLGLAQRATAGIKVRQPLNNVDIVTSTTLEDDYLEIIKDELNVKHTTLSDGEHLEIKIDDKITTKLRHEGRVRDVIRAVQSARKESGLEVSDRIELGLSSPELKSAIDGFKDLIMQETLAVKLTSKVDGYQKTVNIDGNPLLITLKQSDGHHL